MNIIPILSTNNTFRARVSNIKIKDSAAESLKILSDAIDSSTKNFPDSTLTVGNKKVIHTPYVAGYFTKQKDFGFGFVFDDSINNTYHIFINKKYKTPDNKTLVKSFDYYKGHPSAPDPVPSISYSEFTVFDFNTFKNYVYKEGSEIPDEISDKIKNLIDATIKSLGIK